MGEGSAQQADGREGVEGEEVDDHLVGQLGRRAERDGPRGEHQAIEPAVPVDRALHDLLGGARPAQVRGHAQRIEAEGGQPVAVPGGQGQLGARVGEPPAQRGTQPTRGTGDQEAQTVEFRHAGQPVTQRLGRQGHR